MIFHFNPDCRSLSRATCGGAPHRSDVLTRNMAVFLHEPTFCYKLCQYCAAEPDQYKHYIAMHDIGPMPQFQHPVYPGVCQVCKGNAATPFKSCLYCLERPAWHEGRCCPYRNAPQPGSVKFRQEEYARMLREQPQLNAGRSGSRANSRASSRANNRASSRHGSGGSNGSDRRRPERAVMRQGGVFQADRQGRGQGTSSPRCTPRVSPSRSHQGSQSGTSTAGSGKGPRSSSTHRTAHMQSGKTSRSNYEAPSSTCCKKSRKSSMKG